MADPIIFKGFKALTLADTQQQSLLRLALEGISVQQGHALIDLGRSLIHPLRFIAHTRPLMQHLAVSATGWQISSLVHYLVQNRRRIRRSRERNPQTPQMGRAAVGSQREMVTVLLKKRKGPIEDLPGHRWAHVRVLIPNRLIPSQPNSTRQIWHLPT